MNKLKFIFLLSFLASCNDGGGWSAGPPLVGYVVDAPVEGLTYSCNGLTGTTGSDGSFLHDSGAACIFKIGNITIGEFNSAPTDGIVTPHDLAGVPRGDSLNSSAVAIAQFLQSLDDGTDSGKIKIPTSVITALSSVPEQKIVDATATLAQTQITLSNLVSTATGNSKPLVSPVTAGVTMNSYISTAYPTLDEGKGTSASRTSSTSGTTTTYSAPLFTVLTPNSLTAVLSTGPLTAKTDIASIRYHVVLSAKTDIASIGYYVALPVNAPAPNKWQIIAGFDTKNKPVSLSGSFNMNAGTATTLTIPNLQFSGNSLDYADYRVYLIAANALQTSKLSDIAITTVSEPNPFECGCLP